MTATFRCDGERPPFRRASSSASRRPEEQLSSSLSTEAYVEAMHALGLKPVIDI